MISRFPAKSIKAAALVLHMHIDMDDRAIARALNHLGKDADLFSADEAGILDLIEDDFIGDDQHGSNQPRTYCCCTYM